MTVFNYTEQLPSDEYTRDLIEAIVTRPEILRNGSVHGLIQQLGGLAPHAPKLVCRAAVSLVDILGKEMGDMRTSLAADAGELIEVALTLQRMQDFRAAGLNLFERLLELNVYGAAEALLEVDRRVMPTGVAPARRRRRERAAKRRSARQ